MAERISYARFLEFEKVVTSAVGEGRMNAVAARDGVKHVRVSTECGNHEEARLYVDDIMENLSNA